MATRRSTSVSRCLAFPSLIPTMQWPLPVSWAKWSNRVQSPISCAVFLVAIISCLMANTVSIKFGHRARSRVGSSMNKLQPKGRWDTSEEDDSKAVRSEEHTSELQSQSNLVCRLLLEKKKKKANEEQW